MSQLTVPPAFRGPPYDRGEASDLDLLQIEIETLWATDARGRIYGPDLVIASSRTGCDLALGVDVADDLAGTLAAIVGAAPPPTDLTAPPAPLEPCRRLLEPVLGPVTLTPGSGPSYLIPDTVAFRSAARLVRSDSDERWSLRGANPGNWRAEEWSDLLAGHLEPWVMAIRDGLVISICHTPRYGTRGAEAGVWTRPGYRGHGHAAAVTAEWSALMRQTGRHLFYSTSRTNRSSQAVAARLGLRAIGWLWQLAGSQEAST
jgi:RimJ/RimL family protein N-acetyltransferase